MSSERKFSTHRGHFRLHSLSYRGVEDFRGGSQIFRGKKGDMKIV